MGVLFPHRAIATITALIFVNLPCPAPADERTSADGALLAAAQAARAAAITPTVTKATGDAGGKFFGQPPDPAKTRRYYIAAEIEAWDFLPEKRDVVCGKPLPPQLVDNHVSFKVRYIQYTDATFTTKLLPTPRLGVLGPVLRGVVGETLAVTFLNKTDLPLSMHPHGVKYDKDSEGSFYQPKPGLGAAVGPGAKFTYVWQLDEASGPRPEEPSSKAWLYHSHVLGDAEANLGLVGFIIVTDPKRARPDGTPNDVDREMASLFMIFNESGEDDEAGEADEYAALGLEAPPPKTWAETQEQIELSARFAINGSLFGNLPGLEMNEGERVRWYLLGLGSEEDFHTAHWHGLRVFEEGRRRTDVVELLPASMKIADLVADNPGSWIFHCHVAEHMQQGMFARLTVHPRQQPAASRASEVAFFGMTRGEQSLRIQQAELSLDPAPGAVQPCELRLVGTATVFDAFSVFTQKVTLEIGGKTAAFLPGSDGLGAADDVRYRVLNSGRFGVVYGGQMQFEAVFRGAEWRAVLERLGALRDGALTPDTDLQLKLGIGNARHTATFRLTAAPR